MARSGADGWESRAAAWTVAQSTSRASCWIQAHRVRPGMTVSNPYGGGHLLDVTDTEHHDGLVILTGWTYEPDTRREEHIHARWRPNRLLRRLGQRVGLAPHPGPAHHT